MYVAITKPLFAWDCLQDSASLGTIRQFLASIPDGKLLEGLRLHRGRGRNDCPVYVAWGVVLPRIALRHVSVEATRAELGRNEALRRLIGIEKEESVPKSCNISRFLDLLGRAPHRAELRRIFDCPARHEGWTCPHDAVCNAGKSYGKTVRVDRAIDLRRFPPIPRATKKFERLYDGRTSVERVNARLKLFWGVDDGNLVGARRFHAMVGAVLIVHVAFATLLAAAPRREGTLGKLRLRSIQKALQQSTA